MLSTGARMPPYSSQKPNIFTATLPRKQIPFVLLQTKVFWRTFDWWTWSHLTSTATKIVGKWAGLIMRCFSQYESTIFPFTRCKLVRKRINAHQDSKVDTGWGSDRNQYLQLCFALCLLFCYQETLLTLGLNSNVFATSSAYQNKHVN